MLKYYSNSNNSNYKYWMCLNFLAEISTIFLSLDAVIKNLSVITGVGNKYKIIGLTLKSGIYIVLYFDKNIISYTHQFINYAILSK